MQQMVRSTAAKLTHNGRIGIRVTDGFRRAIGLWMAQHMGREPVGQRGLADACGTFQKQGMMQGAAAIGHGEEFQGLFMSEDFGILRRWNCAIEHIVVAAHCGSAVMSDDAAFAEDFLRGDFLLGGSSGSLDTACLSMAGCSIASFSIASFSIVCAMESAG